MAPVGIRCPEHSGVSRSPAARVAQTRTGRRLSYSDALVTQGCHDLVAACVQLGRPLAYAWQRSRLQAHPDAEGLHGS